MNIDIAYCLSLPAKILLSRAVSSSSAIRASSSRRFFASASSLPSFRRPVSRSSLSPASETRGGPLPDFWSDGPASGTTNLWVGQALRRSSSRISQCLSISK